MIIDLKKCVLTAMIIAATICFLMGIILREKGKRELGEKNLEFGLYLVLCALVFFIKTS